MKTIECNCDCLTTIEKTVFKTCHGEEESFNIECKKCGREVDEDSLSEALREWKKEQLKCNR